MTTRFLGVKASLELLLVLDHLVVGGLPGAHLLLQALQLLTSNIEQCVIMSFQHGTGIKTK